VRADSKHQGGNDDRSVHHLPARSIRIFFTRHLPEHVAALDFRGVNTAPHTAHRFACGTRRRRKLAARR
jgi:hypothetical protein